VELFLLLTRLTDWFIWTICFLKEFLNMFIIIIIIFIVVVVVVVVVFTSDINFGIAPSYI